MRIHHMTVAAIAALAIGTSGAAAAQNVTIQKPVPYSEDNDIADNIKTECRIGEQLSDFLKESAGVPVSFASGALDTSKGRVLQLEVTDAVSMGNAWMGHQKYTKVRGSLYENGKKVASFKARRNSMGGAFAGYKGSCSVLGRTVKAIAQDIGGWLKAPRDGANLGQ